MKNVLIAATLLATVAMPITTASAAGKAAVAPKLSAVCFLLPLLPDCLAAWKAKEAELMSKSAPKSAMLAPRALALPTCTKAAAGSGHLYDCKI